MTPVPDALTGAVRAAVVALPTTHVHKLASALAAHPGPGPAALAAATASVPTTLLREHARRIVDAWEDAPEITGPSLALALRAAADAVSQLRASQSTDIAWTGPATAEVPVRLTREVLLEVIGSATWSLILVSFAAYKVTDVTAALAEAARRGVDVRLVLETSEADGGTLKGPGAARAFSSLAELVTIYEWPAERRAPLPDGGRGAMHAKAALADEHTALVTSGNLTDYALTANMELGLLVRGGPVPRRLSRHFRQLMMDGVLTVLG